MPIHIRYDQSGHWSTYEDKGPCRYCKNGVSTEYCQNIISKIFVSLLANKKVVISSNFNVNESVTSKIINNYRTRNWVNKNYEIFRTKNQKDSPNESSLVR